MKQQKSTCSTLNCQNSVQASCFKCKQFLCFSCSLHHTKSYEDHPLLEIKKSISHVQEQCNTYIRQLKLYEVKVKKKKKESESENIKGQHDERLNPQKFQEQLNYVSTMEKQTIKIVEKFFSELSLELVNIWEKYLEQFSNVDISIEKIGELIIKIEQFVQHPSKSDAVPFIKNYFENEFEEEVEECKRMALKQSPSPNNIPECPQIQISQKMLISLSELLCSQITTKNYQTKKKKKPHDKIQIEINDTLNKTVKFIPIFPIKKKICYLYNIHENNFQIQEFDKLDILPAFPKSILLENGDLHIIGGANSKEQAVDSHIVFRSTTAEVFKLSNLPLRRNPVNALLARDKTIYIIGGLNEKKEWDRKCFRYSLQKKQWKQIAPMITSKPHQSTGCFNQNIYCFGIPIPGKVNIQKYETLENTWKQISITNFLCNPFNFASGFSTVQINSEQMLLFGGKKFLENIKNNKRSTDREVTPYMYLFRPENNSFQQLGMLNPCVGVRDGEINPIIREGRIYALEYLITGTQPLCRWLSSLHLLQIASNGKAQSVMILHEE